MSSVPETTLTLYQVGGDAGVDSVLLDPSPEVEAVQNGERLSRGRAADLLGIRRDELDELAEAGLIVVRQDVDGKPYVTAAAFRKFLKGLEPIQFIEAPTDEGAEDDDDEEEEAVPAPKAKAVTKPAPAAPAAEDEAAEDDIEAEADQVSILGSAAAVAAFFKKLFGGEQAEEELEPEPVKQTKANPLFGLGKSRKSRRSGR
ncbi:MAG: hypothetical protein M1401_09350 [Chloroflexi bacterium]|nr:hypothetical protein [Chloroflexota bacterium]MCL5109051.1 hypothetical protein [Chloroflexota bacterium]MDA8219673.1 hypothetical protein [Dehalococcoidales bacterium]